MTTSSFSSSSSSFDVDLSTYPPPVVLWLTHSIDLLCRPLQCSHWRERVGVSEDSWLYAKVPSLDAYLPRLTTYPEFSDSICSSSGSTSSTTSTFSCLYKYAFQTNSTALGDLTTPTAIFTLLLIVMILRALKSVLLPIFRSFGRTAGKSTHGAQWEHDNAVRINKFGEYVFRLIYHFSISIFGLVYFWDKEWWAPGGTISLYAGFPYHPVEPGMAWYYLLQSAYNLDALLSLLGLSFTLQWKYESPLKLPLSISWSSNVRGDFREMLVHHVVTNLLAIGSSHCRLTRIGSMVFLVHDLSDVPVDLSKLANFLKYKRTTIACFISMSLMWFVTRLLILPFKIYRSVLTQSHFVLQEGLPLLLYLCYRHFFYFLVAFLILLHVAWFGMFIKIFFTMVTKNEVHDYTEHKSGEGQKLTNGTTNGTISKSKLEKRRNPSRHADEKKE